MAEFLTQHRESILRACQRSVETDPELNTPTTLTRAEFYDHLPEILDDFARRLRHLPESGAPAEASPCATRLQEETRRHEIKHGLHRWQKGYRMHEVTREWGHLHLCLVDELEAYAATHPELPASAMSASRRELARLLNEGLTESITQYARLEQDEAAGHARDLYRALEQLSGSERRRSELLREAFHDIGGNVQTMRTTTTLLGISTLPEAERVEYVELLQRSVQTLSALLTELMDLARLEAGQEQRKLETFDAAALARSLCAGALPLARERGLFLDTHGPETLLVEGDRLKVQRIAQNLLYNALKYTERGGVQVRWGLDGEDRWLLCFEDTGPGLKSHGPSSPIVVGMREATAVAREVEGQGDDASSLTSALSENAAAPPSSKKPQQPPGEGIGLSIVKRLCELLDASLEVESSPDAGTAFRVMLPRHYK